MSEHIITHLSSADPVLGALIRAVGPLRLEPRPDGEPFQTLAHAIAHQQLNGIAANTILRRLVEACGNGSFPTPQAILDASTETLRAAGFSFAKIAALKDLAAKTLQAVVPDGHTLSTLEDEAIIERLTQVRGIGRWTVEMLLIFHLGRADVLAVDDFGLRAGFRAAYGLKKLPHPKQLALWGERWRPYRSAAAWYLWRAQDLQRAGKLTPPTERVRLPRLKRVRRRKPARTAKGKRAAVRRRSGQKSRAAVQRKRPTAPRRVRSVAASSAPPRRSGGRSGSHRPPARRPRAPARRK